MGLLARSAVVVATVAASTLLGTNVAQASYEKDGICDPGEFCLYYNSSKYNFGSLHDYQADDPYLFDDTFISPGRGQGQIVANNAAAYWNRSPGTVYVYTLGQFGGTVGSIPPGLPRRDFSLGYKNNVESFWCWACYR